MSFFSRFVQKIKKNPWSLLPFLFLSLIFGIVGLFLTYSLITLFNNPAQTFGYTSKPYGTIVGLEAIAALIVAFLNFRNKKRKKIKEEKAIPSDKNSKYFFYSLFVVIMFFGLINFGELTQFSTEYLNYSILNQSWILGAVIGIITTMFVFKEKGLVE